jgi:hypothetical protein
MTVPLSPSSIPWRSAHAAVLAPDHFQRAGSVEQPELPAVKGGANPSCMGQARQ